MPAGTPAATTPNAVRAPRGGTQMEIDWADGHTSVYRLASLRAACPCIACRGDEAPASLPLDPRAQDLEDIEEAGNYALALRWGDGHQTGIYSFAYLRDLCACEICRRV